MRILVFMIAVVACTPTVMIVNPPARPAAESTTRIVVTADLRKRGAGGPAALAPGQLVSEGDEVALNVQVGRDVYVYVVYVAANGVVAELYPKTGDAIAHAGTERLPLGGWWQLDAVSGAVSFVVLAAAAPLSATNRHERAAQLSPAASQSRAAPSRAPAAAPTPRRGPQSVEKRVRAQAKPGTSDALSDEGKRLPAEVVDAIVAEPGPDGVATAVFTINHR
jgi:hypothetical protein